jgi:RNA polymerase sigma-70 factor (ECF subfamily)
MRRRDLLRGAPPEWFRAAALSPVRFMQPRWNDSVARSFAPSTRQMMRAPTYLTLVPEPNAADEKICYSDAVRGAKSNLPSHALEHIDALYRVARSLTGRDDDAEDLVQETYSRAIGRWAQFTEGTNLRAWLFRILRNAYIDNYRRARTNPVDLGYDEESGPPATATREPLRGDAELDRLRNAVTSDIEAALATLSLDARTIILLDLEGFTEAELADALGCAAGTVKSRLARARAILRERLRDYGS